MFGRRKDAENLTSMVMALWLQPVERLLTLNLIAHLFQVNLFHF